MPGSNEKGKPSAYAIMMQRKRREEKRVQELCLATTRGGKKCQKRAGWGTSHPGTGKCKLHGGATVSHTAAAAKKVAARMDCGSVWINKHGAIQPNAPFGGVKESGYGSEGGIEGLQAYMNVKFISQA